MIHRHTLPGTFAALPVGAWFRLVIPTIGYDGAYIKRSNRDDAPNAVRVNDFLAVWLSLELPVEPMALETISFTPTQEAA